ncbi:MAG TPA: hypothetical protein VJ623_06805 [Holophagaceae bacterium]|nr:hypothetical protein [Holophagaceae bacterium]
MSDVEIPSLPGPLRMLLLAFLILFSAQVARAQEPVLVSFHDAIGQEVQSQGFTLPRDAKVHVYARGGASHGWGRSPFFAYGWILNANTREVVWQMDGRTSQRQDGYEVADRYLDLPKGSYEAYYSNHGFERKTLFMGWSRNIDRRTLAQEERTDRDRGGFLEDLQRSQLARWRKQAVNYGMEIYLPGGDPKEVTRFEAPLRWKRELLSFTRVGDSGHWSQAFRVKHPITLHVYAQGERVGENRFADHGWIVDARSGKRVWAMEGAKAQYAGGHEKNRRQVETIRLPEGDYIASYVTDDSHSPADWNEAPPCDPLMYGLTLSVPDPADLPHVALVELKRPDRMLAELVRVGNDEDLKAPFTLTAKTTLRIYALGEGDGDDMADFGWIEDAQGHKVWEQRYEETTPAGGASKNRQTDTLVELPKGTYTLRFQTDGSHAYGHWNSRRPTDEAHYGITVYTGN